MGFFCPTASNSCHGEKRGASRLISPNTCCYCFCVRLRTVHVKQWRGHRLDHSLDSVINQIRKLYPVTWLRKVTLQTRDCSLGRKRMRLRELFNRRNLLLNLLKEFVGVLNVDHLGLTMIYETLSFIFSLTICCPIGSKTSASAAKHSISQGGTAASVESGCGCENCSIDATFS